jgi:hypothetical protein
MRGTLATAAFVLAAFGAPRAASAEEADDTQPEAPPPKPHYALQLDPLAWFIGRFGVDFETLVASHHGLTTTLHGDYQAPGFNVFNSGGNTTQYSGFGGELGWHIYALPDELRGWWIGPSVVFGVYEQGVQGSPSTTFSQVGIAMDTGARFGTQGFGLDLGLGVQMAHTSTPDTTQGPVSLFVSQVRPRMLMGVGWVF